MDRNALTHAVEFIDSLAAYRLARQKIPGMVVGIAVKGRFVLHRAYGFANAEDKIPMRAAHLFRVASHSKMFTSVAILQLAQAGHLSLDDNISSHLPWLRAHRDPRIKTITIRQVLSHGAGLVRDGSARDFWTLGASFPDVKQLKHEVLASRLILEPNQRMKYSNFGFGLLGLLIESVTGQPFERYVQANIFRRLGLKDTGVEYSKQIERRLVTGYSRYEPENERLSIEQIVTHSLASATGFYSCARDLNRFMWELCSTHSKILSQKQMSEMQHAQWTVGGVPWKAEYGLGLRIFYVGSRRLIGHGGGFPGQSTCSLIDPQNGLMVTVLMNCTDGEAGLIAQAIIRTIDFFQNNFKSAPLSAAAQAFQGRFCNLWGTYEFVSLGAKRLVAVNPDGGWDMFRDPLDEYTVVNANRLRLVKSSSFDALGEIARFSRDGKGRIVAVTIGAAKWLPK